MKTYLCLLTLVVGLPVLSAGQKSYELTPATLSEWIMIGGDGARLPGGRELTVPKDAQLTRAFPGSNFVVQLTTQPELGEDPADWPIVEIGGIALIFSRAGSVGTLQVVTGDDAPFVFTKTFVLDRAGRSQQPLVLSVAAQAGIVQVDFGGDTTVFPDGREMRDGFEVVLAAGTNRPLSLGQLLVQVTTKDPVGPAPVFPSGEVDPVAQRLLSILPPEEPRKDGPVMPKDLANAPLAQADVVTDPALKSATRRSTLRLFTPPAFGKSRIESIRATLRRQNSR